QTARGLAGPGTDLADMYLPVRVNGDLALFAGFNKALAEREDANPGTVFDQDFIDSYTDGFDEVISAWRALDWDTITAQSGLSRQRIEAFTQMVLDAHATTVCWAMGLTQHRNAV